MNLIPIPLIIWVAVPEISGFYDFSVSVKKNRRRLPLLPTQQHLRFPPLTAFFRPSPSNGRAYRACGSGKDFGRISGDANLFTGNCEDAPNSNCKRVPRWHPETEILVGWDWGRSCVFLLVCLCVTTLVTCPLCVVVVVVVVLIFLKEGFLKVKHCFCWNGNGVFQCENCERLKLVWKRASTNGLASKLTSELCPTIWAPTIPKNGVK